MNAYELAEELFQLEENHLLMLKASNMLSQQAGELEYYKVRDSSHIKTIKELHKQAEHYKNKAEYLDKRELELLAEIKSLEKDLYMIQRHYDQLETFSPSGNNTKDVGDTNETLPKGKE